MNRTEKQDQIQSMAEQFERANMSVVAGYKGLSVAQLTDFRSRLNKVDGQFRVVKNTLAKRAVADRDEAGLSEHFTGAVGVVFAYGDPAAVAKVVKEFGKEAEQFSVTAGLIEGQVLDAEGVGRIASLPSREELIAKMFGSMISPLSGLVNVLSGNQRNLVYVLSAIAGKKAA